MLCNFVSNKTKAKTTHKFSVRYFTHKNFQWFCNFICCLDTYMRKVTQFMRTAVLLEQSVCASNQRDCLWRKELNLHTLWLLPPARSSRAIGKLHPQPPRKNIIERRRTVWPLAWPWHQNPLLQGKRLLRQKLVAITASCGSEFHSLTGYFPLSVLNLPTFNCIGCLKVLVLWERKIFFSLHPLFLYA